MRKIVLILGVSLTTGLIGQVLIDFELPDYGEINIEPNDSTNVWQIGEPQKTLFHSAYSQPRAVVTDTMNSYAVNDTSTFTIRNSHYQWMWPTLSFFYKMDSDTLDDLGKLEASYDNGTSWVDLLTDTSNIGIEWSSSREISPGQWETLANHWNSSTPFTGLVDEWHFFWITVFGWDQSFGYHDSITYRLTFISDSIETSREGWIIDEITAIDEFSSIPEHDFNLLASISPNPTKEHLKVSLINNAARIEELLIHDVQGRELLRSSPNINSAQVDVTELPQGVYLLQISTTGGKRSTTRFVKE